MFRPTSRWWHSQDGRKVQVFVHGHFDTTFACTRRYHVGTPLSDRVRILLHNHGTPSSFVLHPFGHQSRAPLEGTCHRHHTEKATTIPSSRKRPPSQLQERERGANVSCTTADVLIRTIDSRLHYKYLMIRYYVLSCRTQER